MKKYLKITGAGLLGIALIFSACVNSDYTPPDYDVILENNLTSVDPTQLSKDKQEIDDSLHNEWHYNDVQIDQKGGVRYRVLELGTGEKPVLTSLILIKYRGLLFDSAKFLQGQFTGPSFDSNQAPTQYFPLYNLIAGMQTAMPLFPKGSRVQLFIPSGLGYGPFDRVDQQTNDLIIPKNSNLIFEVTLLDVQTQQQ